MYWTVILLVNFLFAVNAHYVPGFYWRDFDGTVPDDALPGGTDLNGKPIYIGQVYAYYLIPAKIYKNDKRAYYEYGGEELNVTENIKILCTQHPDDFYWIPTDNDRIKSIANVTLVLGGYEPGCSTYIGRTRKYGEVLVGKALADNHPDNAGLHITQRGKKFRATSFEVLSFDSNEISPE
ncbi:hypothetical protein RN001_015303 [Aquatica leii]|uniref:DUF3421 domain containing protein n=1 Tax=Aquatica leii TaxID=1421715 RepID=A0AAN7PPH4_9COLE|nr:hypothetical protein RN001_015303 [Aquatica leii]